MHQDLLDKCLLMHCLQIAIFTLETMKRFACANKERFACANNTVKRFACANKQRAQQTGALPTELTRRWSNWGSGSHGQLFRPYWGSSAWYSRRSMNRENPSMKDPLVSPPPHPTFRQAPPPLLFRYITENSFFMGNNNENIW